MGMLIHRHRNGSLDVRETDAQTENTQDGAEPQVESEEDKPKRGRPKKSDTE